LGPTKTFAALEQVILLAKIPATATLFKFALPSLGNITTNRNKPISCRELQKKERAAVPLAFSPDQNASNHASVNKA
jgi:hypothetical protein